MYRGAACFACKQLVVWQNISHISSMLPSVYTVYTDNVQEASLHRFWFLPGISQSLGFERVTDVTLDRAGCAASVLSACQELEKVM